MVILANCPDRPADEGYLKVSSTLIKKIKAAYPAAVFLRYKLSEPVEQGEYRVNKFFLEPHLFQLIRKNNREILHIPFESNTISSIIRTWVLSVFCGRKVSVLYVLRHPMNRLAEWLLQRSGARIIVLSRESRDFFRDRVDNEILYLKTGVDTQKFKPVPAEEKIALRERYGISPQEKVVLHVGHLKAGRNVQQLLQIRGDYRVLLVVSTKTKHEQDDGLRAQLEVRPNITVIDSFVEKIEEIYQLADIYVFPVQAEGNCIDVPLSVLEAAACGIPVVSTPYGEVKELIREDGFYEITSFEPDNIHALLDKALAENKTPRPSVEQYDWGAAVQTLLDRTQQKGE